MNIRNEKGLTGIDISISIVIITVFIALIALFAYCVSLFISNKAL